MGKMEVNHLLKAKKNWVRLPLTGVLNCRELGGYSVGDFEQTAWHAFLRASDMSQLAPADIEFLKEYGVKAVIDLRSSDEIVTHPNPLKQEDFCQYHNIPLITGQVSNIIFNEQEVGMGDFYIEMLKNPQAIQRIFETIAQVEEGCIVFHCMAGKDRTGVLAMLLLGLAGVEKRDIMANYEVTYTYIEPMFTTVDIPREIPHSLLSSERESIGKAYQYIIEQFGSVERYLQQGVSKEVIEKVKSRLIV